MLGVRDTARDALIVAALGEPQQALASWRKWRQTDRDPLRDAIAQRWLPLVASNLSASALDSEERALFAAAQRGVWAANTRLLDAGLAAAGILHDLGIQTVVLKGAALALSVYRTHAERPIGDVDLLVRPQDAAAARRALTGHGWRPLRQVREADLVWRHALDLTKPPHGAVDLHWYLLPENAWAAADAGLWERVRPLPAYDSRLFALGAADQLLHTCLHGLRWSPVHAAHWIADARQTLATEPHEIDWQVVIDECLRRRLSFQMAAALRLVSASTGASVPPLVLAALDAHPVTWREQCEARVKGRPVVSIGGIFGTWCRWRRIRAAAGPGRPGWLRFLAAAVGVDSRLALAPWALRHTRTLVAGALGMQPPSPAHSRGRRAA
jgi:hypothetical protein